VRNWKKWIRIIMVCILMTLNSTVMVQAKEGTVYEQFENKSQQGTPSEAEKQSVEPAKESVVPYALQFIGSFLLILLLLFVVLKFLAKKSKSNAYGGPFHPLGGHSLGNNRSLQMLMIADTLYIVGVGNDVNLIRAIPPGEEQRRLLESIAEKPLDTVSKWGAQLKKNSHEKWNDLLIKQLNESSQNGKGGDER
jgi:flagellar protein FliO/FliZ